MFSSKYTLLRVLLACELTVTNAGVWSENKSKDRDAEINEVWLF